MGRQTLAVALPRSVDTEIELGQIMVGGRTSCNCELKKKKKKKKKKKEYKKIIEIPDIYPINNLIL